MPADFDKQEYWHQRFSAESAFEWLVPSAVFMSLLRPRLDEWHLDPSSSAVLHLGFGTSDLQHHLRAAGFGDVLNVDYEPLAVARGPARERRAFGDVRMRYLVADATRLPLGPAAEALGGGAGGAFALAVDKSAADAVACGGDDAVLRMARGVARCLAPGGAWVSLSYLLGAPLRFDVAGLPFDVDVLARLPAPRARPTDPEVFYYSYLLRPQGRRADDELLTCS